MTVIDHVIDRGSDYAALVTLRDDDGERVNLAEYTVSIFEAHAALRNHITLAVSNADLGQMMLEIEWSDGMPMGRTMGFQMMFEIGGDTITSPQQWVVVK